MPQLPKNIIAFKDGLGADKRINLDTVYTDQRKLNADLSFQVSDLDEFLKEERPHNAIYLQTLSRMLAKEGYDISAEKLFAEAATAGTHYSSPAIIALMDYSKAPASFFDERVGPRESTTRFDLIFNADYRQLKGDDTTVSCPLYYYFDAAAIQALTDHGISRPELELWVRNFMKLAMLAEHDADAHELLLNKLPLNTRVDFADDKAILSNSTKKLKIPPPITDKHMEDHAQSQHAQVLAKMFEDSPKRKFYALANASDNYLLLQQMQIKALAHCKTDAELQGGG